MEATGVLFDVLILAALGATIFRAMKLSRQFEQMQADRKAFESLITALNLASSRAEAAIQGLKGATVEGGERLQEKINKARALSEELEIMVQAGDSLAERLQVLAEKSRKAATAEAEAPAPSGGVKPALEPRSRAEKELLDALKSRLQT